MNAIILDTDVASNIIKGKLDPRMAVQLVGHDLVISFITLGELTQWVELRQWGPHRRETLAKFLDGRAVLPGSKAVATTWGSVCAEATRNGQPRPVNDSWIAACCLTYRLPLATFNVKDYSYFRDRHSLSLITV